MEPERPLTSKIDRPVTRWHRETDDSAKNESKSVSRPVSRRGMKDNIENSPTANYRSATPSRNTMTRPPSASVVSHRVSTAGSRLTTMGSSLGLGQIMDRPITQQGMAGIRPGTTRGLPMTRQIQDKRYYEGLLQLKLRELNQEISMMKRDIDLQNKEKATFLHYDKRAKDLATELTTLQGELADYNIVVDRMTSNIDKETIQEEVRELVEVNNIVMNDIERLFEQRQEMGRQLRKIEMEVNKEKQSTQRLIEGMDTKMKSKYDDLLKKKIELQGLMDKMQQELDNLSKEQIRLEEQIALSQLKQEAAKLHVKIMDAEEKRDKLQEEEQNRLSPEMERERLLQKVKQDNMDIGAAEGQLTEKKKRIVEAEHEIEQLETDLEDNQSEKQIKYKELRRREEAMEQFMSTFEQNKNEEMEKMEKLEKDTVTHLMVISNEIDIDVHLTPAEEMSILIDQSSLDDYEKVNEGKSFEELTAEYKKLSRIYKKLDILEERMVTESNELNDKVDKRENELIVLEDLEGLRKTSQLKTEELSIERKQLIIQKPICEEELKTVEEEYTELKGRLEKNEVYNQISSLESNLEKLKQDSQIVEEFISEQKQRNDYIPIKQRALKLAQEYNNILKESVKTQ